jgi:NAD(P)-dependent dehydrogenase (short-subunit alcohol dehydrogenase family)
MTTSKKPVAIITGASRGLGEALARALADGGWRLVIDARGTDALAAVAADLSTRTEVIALPGDVVDDDHRARLAVAAAELGGAVLLVNNASILGGSPPPPLATFPLPALLATFEVNVLAPLALTQLVLPQLRAQAATGVPAAVLNVSSDAAVEAYPGWGGYGAAKAALDHATAVLAVEEPTVRFWAVDPGDLRTQLHQEAYPGADISDRPLPASVVPVFLSLIRGTTTNGRYRATELVASR